ncbi:hypothetical protein [Neisseria sp.]|nr:hypothetical protein [Neisseria sp.]
MIEKLMPIFAVIGVISFSAYLALFVYVGCKKFGIERFLPKHNGAPEAQ